VDTLALHDSLGPALNPIFADPGILKVLHGCANDVAWLQRDFHIYLVNVFDTEKAAQVRDEPLPKE
jgi:ribonuclease D